MPPSKGNDFLLEKLIENLDESSKQLSKVMETIHSNEIDFASLKTELRFICDNVEESTKLGKELSDRILIMEEKQKHFEEKIKVLEKSKEDSALAVADKTGKWQYKIAALGAVLALLTSLGHAIARAIMK